MSPLLGWTLAASLGAHVIVLSLHFELPKLFKKATASPPLAVSLVNAKTATKPSQADFLAQANLDGGGNTDAKRRLSSPLPRAAVDSQNTQLSAAREQVENLERQTRELLKQRKRPVCTVLTKRRDSCYAASAECSVVFTVVGGKSAATFHGRSSAILLMR